MTYLVDTNVLLRYADRTDPRHPTAHQAVAKLGQLHQMRSTSQNLIECWNVMTRPADRNGFGMSPSRAKPLLQLLEQLFPRLPDPPEVYDRWRDLVVRFKVSGVQVHDARLVAVMLANEVTQILTFNVTDFRRYTQVGILATDPANV